jgi:WD40 repeat protein
LATGRQASPPLTGHTNSVRAVACATLPDGRAVAVTGGNDRTVRVWDIQDLHSKAPRFGDPTPAHVIDVEAPVLALDVQAEAAWLVATSSGILALEPVDVPPFPWRAGG